MTKLQKNILSTICYYDVLDYPLTSFEVWKFLISYDYFDNNLNEPFSYEEVLEELESEEIKRKIGSLKGFYFLKGRKKLIDRRIEKDKLSVYKIRRLRRIIWLLRFAPFVRGVMVTGRLAMKNAQSKSDWDVLVIIKKGRIWMGRTLVTSFIHLIGKRRYGRKIKDRVCLNYYLTDKTLEISTKDLYSANEYFFSFPIFNSNIYKKFQLENGWISKFKPNYYVSEKGNLKEVEDSLISRNLRYFGELILDWQGVENLLFKLEDKKIKKNPKTKQIGSMVHSSDEALIFLPDPQGPKIFEKFKKKVEEVF